MSYFTPTAMWETAPALQICDVTPGSVRLAREYPRHDTALSQEEFELLQLHQWLQKNPGLKDKALADAVAVPAAAVLSRRVHRRVTFADEPRARWVEEPGVFMRVTLLAAVVDVAVPSRTSTMRPPGDTLTSYARIGAPPSGGGVHDTRALASPAAALTCVGAPGADCGVTSPEGVETGPGPRSLTAATVNV